MSSRVTLNSAKIFHAKLQKDCKNNLKLTELSQIFPLGLLGTLFGYPELFGRDETSDMHNPVADLDFISSLIRPPINT